MRPNYPLLGIKPGIYPQLLAGSPGQHRMVLVTADQTRYGVLVHTITGRKASCWSKRGTRIDPRTIMTTFTKVDTRPPMETTDPDGITVSAMIRLLATANPDARLVWAPGWAHVRRAALEVSGVGARSRPVVVLWDEVYES